MTKTRASLRVTTLAHSSLDELPPAAHLCAEIALAHGTVNAIDTVYPDARRAPLENATVQNVTRQHLAIRRPKNGGSRQRAAFAEAQWLLKSLWKLLRQPGDVLVAFDFVSLPVVLIASRVRRRPFVYEAFEYVAPHERAGQSPLNRALLRLEGFGARRAHTVACPEPTRAERMRSELGLIELPVVVRNAMPTRGAALRPGALRGLLPLAEDAKIAIFQGGISDTREFRALVESLVLLPADLQLVFVGWGDQHDLDALREHARDQGVAERVWFVDTLGRDELWSALADSDVALVLYGNRIANEQLAAPNKLGEYVMAGLPVVYLSNEGVGRLLAPEEFAYEVEEAAPERFSEQIERAVSERRGRHAREFAEREYNFRQQAQPLVNRIVEMAK